MGRQAGCSPYIFLVKDENEERKVNLGLAQNAVALMKPGDTITIKMLRGPAYKEARR